MALIIGSARHDENGKYSGGRNGDQDGTEVSTQTYYVHSKGWRLIRAKDPAVADKLASAMLEACNNNHIGYDQNDRYIISKVKKYGSLAKISEDCDTDCCDLVRACVYQASGMDCGDCYTATEAVYPMIKFYVSRIKAGRLTLEQIPELWRTKVIEALNEEATA